MKAERYYAVCRGDGYVTVGKQHAHQWTQRRKGRRNKMQFKVGDKVRFDEKVGVLNTIESGVGIVVDIDRADEWDDGQIYLVHSEDIKLGHSGSGFGESQNNNQNLWFSDEEMELIEEDDMEKLKVGDEVRFDNSVYQGIGEIVRVDTDGTVLVKSYDITDGHSGFLFDDNTNHFWFDIDDVTKLVSFSEFVESLDWDEDYVECNIAHHLGVCDKLNDIYGDKNRDYGNSFGDQFKEHGIISSVIRLDDKMRRLKQITQNGASVEDETVLDTLYDMANYAIMTIMELEERDE